MIKKKEKNVLTGRLIFLVLSILWGLIVIYGFFTFGWIGRLPDLTPAELVVQTCSLLFPVGVFWLIGDYVDRKRLVSDEISAIKNYLEELVYPSDLGEAYVHNLTGELKQQIQLFKSSFSDVSEQTNQVREELTEWIEDLNKIIGHMDTQTKNMAKYVQQLSQSNQEAQARSAEAGRYLAAQADLLVQVGEKSSLQLEEVGKQLGTQAEAVAQNAHAVVQSEKIMTNSLDKSTKMIGALEENARRIEKAMKTTDVMESFLTDTDNVLLRFKEIGTTLDMRLNSLKKHKEETPVVQETVQKEPAAKIFTEQMQQILDILQGISVEMVPVFHLKNEEDLWNRYYGGDKTIFMRHIGTTLTEAKKQKILDLAKKNPEFSKSVEKYMHAFEDLTRGLGDSPWLGVLVGSDPGRLYMLLANLFNRKKTTKEKATK